MADTTATPVPAPEAKPSKVEVRTAMQTWFGPGGDKGIGLEDALKEEPKEEKPVEKVEEKPVEKPKEEKPKEEPPKEEDKEAPAKEAKPKKVAKKVEPAPAPKVDDETIERVASATAAKTAAAMQEKKSEPVPETKLDGLDLDEEDKERLAEMELAGQADKKYADLKDRTLKFWKAEKDYIDKWQAQNPGKKYEAEDHEEFYTKHEPQFDQAEFRRTVKTAEREALKAELRNETKAEIDSKLSAQKSVTEFKERWEKESPEIDKVSADAKVALITELDPELAKLLEVEHELVVTKETLAKLEEADPVAARVINRNADYLGRLIREVERLDRYPQFYAGDAKNPLHVALFNIAQELEEKVANRPKEELVDEDGRKFIRQHEFNAKLDEIAEGKGTVAEKNAAVEKLRKSYWALEVGDIKEATIKKIRLHAAEKIAEDRKVVELALKKQGKAAPQTPPPETKEEPPAPAPARSKPPAAISGGGDKTSTLPSSAPSVKNTQEAVDQVFFR